MKYIVKNFEACEVVAYEKELTKAKLDKESLADNSIHPSLQGPDVYDLVKILALSKILKSGCLKNRVESVAIVGVGWNILIIHNMW